MSQWTWICLNVWCMDGKQSSNPWTTLGWKVTCPGGDHVLVHIWDIQDTGWLSSWQNAKFWKKRAYFTEKVMTSLFQRIVRSNKTGASKRKKGNRCSCTIKVICYTYATHPPVFQMPNAFAGTNDWVLHWRLFLSPRLYLPASKVELSEFVVPWDAGLKVQHVHYF